jgi:hypothetical protein
MKKNGHFSGIPMGTFIHGSFNGDAPDGSFMNGHFYEKNEKNGKTKEETDADAKDEIDNK